MPPSLFRGSSSAHVWRSLKPAPEQGLLPAPSRAGPTPAKPALLMTPVGPTGQRNTVRVRGSRCTPVTRARAPTTGATGKKLSSSPWRKGAVLSFLTHSAAGMGARAGRWQPLSPRAPWAPPQPWSCSSRGTPASRTGGPAIPCTWPTQGAGSRDPEKEAHPGHHPAASPRSSREAIAHGPLDTENRLPSALLAPEKTRVCSRGRRGASLAWDPDAPAEVYAGGCGQRACCLQWRPGSCGAAGRREERA